MSSSTSRREFIKRTALAVGALSTAASSFAAGNATTANTLSPKSDISVWVTNDGERFAAGKRFRGNLLLKRRVRTQCAWSQATSFRTFSALAAAFRTPPVFRSASLVQERREEFLHDLFHPSAMNLSVNRTCIGAADSAAEVYSYDEGEADPELKRFSIDHDRAYILPILRRVREMNPDVFYFSSPWSPPGWMKWNKSMLGGSMSRQYLSSYAQYMLKFIQAYAAEGVPIQAITTQNEIDTDQHGQMPACTWSQECETEFITDHIGPLFEKTGPPRKYGSSITTMFTGAG